MEIWKFKYGPQFTGGTVEPSARTFQNTEIPYWKSLLLDLRHSHNFFPHKLPLPIRTIRVIPDHITKISFPNHVKQRTCPFPITPKVRYIFLVICDRSWSPDLQNFMNVFRRLVLTKPSSDRTTDKAAKLLFDDNLERGETFRPHPCNLNDVRGLLIHYLFQDKDRRVRALLSYPFSSSLKFEHALSEGNRSHPLCKSCSLNSLSTKMLLTTDARINGVPFSR